MNFVWAAPFRLATLASIPRPKRSVNHVVITFVNYVVTQCTDSPYL